jgi:hypothetical protein
MTESRHASLLLVLWCALGCGGRTAGAGGDAAAPESIDASADVGVSADGQMDVTATGDATMTEGGRILDGSAGSPDAVPAPEEAGDASEEGDAGDANQAGDGRDAASCQDLLQAADIQFAALVQQNLACQSDDDCTRIAPTGQGQCAAICGDVLTDEAGAPTLLAAAGTLCESFVDAGCALPVLGCPAYATLNICVAGTCTGWGASLKWSEASFVHGVCAPFAIAFYTAESMTALAPHDLVFTLEATNGALYADPACTTALDGGSVTLPAGSNSVAFGFVPLAAGQSGFSGPGSDGANIGIDFLAQ